LKIWRSSAEIDPPPWVCITRFHDATPLRVHFGKHSSLATFARYWKKLDDGTNKLLTADELQQLGNSKSLPGAGILELMAQSGASCKQMLFFFMSP
jgi:hypothetical protein